MDDKKSVDSELELASEDEKHLRRWTTITIALFITFMLLLDYELILHDE